MKEMDLSKNNKSSIKKKKVEPEISGIEMTINKQITKKHLIKKSLWDRMQLYSTYILPQVSYDNKDLIDRKTSFYIVTVYFSVFLITFFLIFFSDLNTKLAEKFLSLEGSSDGQICSTVPLPISGDFYVDRNGHWSSSSDFNFNSSIYKLKFEGTVASEDQFFTTLKQFELKLKNLDNLLLTRDLAFTVITWMATIAYDPITSITFQTTADYSSIFRNFVMFGWLQNGSTGNLCHSSCVDGIYGSTPDINQASTEQSFDNSHLQFTWNICVDKTTYIVVEPCIDMFDYRELGPNYGNWIPGMSQNFKIEFDFRSIITSNALNFGILSIESLTETSIPGIIGEKFKEFGRFFIHPSYPSMDQVFCIERDLNHIYLAHPLCVLVKFVGLYAQTYIPLLRSRNPDDNRDCSCHSDISSFYCNSYSFTLKIIGFLKSENFYGVVLFAANEWQTFFSSIDNIDNSNVDFRFSNFIKDFESSSNNLCPSSNNSCTLFYAVLYGPMGSSLLNGYNVQLGHFSTVGASSLAPQVSCKGSIFQEKAFQGMLLSPPVPLIQSYFECQSTINSLAIGIFGSTNGTAKLLADIVLSIFMVILVYWMNKDKTENQKIRSTSEKLSIKTQFDQLAFERITVVLAEILKANPNLKSKAIDDFLSLLDSKDKILSGEKVQGIDIDGISEGDGLFENVMDLAKAELGINDS